MELLGIIPARGRSKAIPRKNLAPLLGRPLISYTCDAARNSHLLTRIVISTDDPEIASVAKSLGVEVPFLRPPALAEDSTPMVPVLQHALRVLKPYAPDIVVLLQPTSPLRTTEHIDSALKLLIEGGADTVVTVVEVPHQFSPASVMQMIDGKLSPYADGPQIFRRQDKPRIYARNGPAVLATRSGVIESGVLYGNHILGLEMTRADSVDVDDIEDLALAEFWMGRRKTS